MTLGKQHFQSKYMEIRHFAVEKHWNICWMCRNLGISKAAYYKWLKREVPAAEQENVLIAQLIEEYDERFNHILGYRRMALWINHLNNKCYSVNRIHRIMKKLGIKSVIRKKPTKYFNVRPETIAENVLKRDFNASKPNEKWVTDVTEFKWYEGGEKRKLYLSAILDLYDRSIVAYEVAKRNDNNLTLSTFEKAIVSNPEGKPIFHSDRGFNYTSKIFQNGLVRKNMIPSMSRVGRCIDNCPMEGFWGIVKSEMYYINKFENEEQLRKAIDDYIYFYNNERLQCRFEGLTPSQVSQEALKTSEPKYYPIAENKRIKKFKEKFIA